MAPFLLVSNNICGILLFIWYTIWYTIIYLVYQNGTLILMWGIPFGIPKLVPFFLVYQIIFGILLFIWYTIGIPQWYTCQCLLIFGIPLVYQNGIPVPNGTTWYTNGIVTRPGSVRSPMMTTPPISSSLAFIFIKWARML